jgi:hypothetical protein
MIMLIRLFCLCMVLIGCTNSSEFLHGEREVFSVFEGALKRNNTTREFVDVRATVTREKIDAAGVPLLFIELESGQNGTSIRYPGMNVGEVWLGLDGATISLKNGVLIATRGMGDDLMSTSGNLPNLNQINGSLSYEKRQTWLSEDNQVSTLTLACVITLGSQPADIEIFNKIFQVLRAEENCHSEGLSVKNLYFLDASGIVRRSKQYHSKALGHILIERLD